MPARTPKGKSPPEKKKLRLALRDLKGRVSGVFPRIKEKEEVLSGGSRADAVVGCQWNVPLAVREKGRFSYL